MGFQNPSMSMHCSKDMECVRFHSDFIQRGITPGREITRTRKIKRASNIFLRGIHIM